MEKYKLLLQLPVEEPIVGICQYQEYLILATVRRVYKIKNPLDEEERVMEVLDIR